MKKLLILITVLGILCCLAGCQKYHGSPATPGNLTPSTPTPFSVHKSENVTEVSADYEKRLCTYPWLDTTDMSYVKLNADGSFICAEDEYMEDTVGSGKWQMLRDSEGYLSMRMEKSGAEAYVMYDLELYDQSIYAYGEDGFAYIWLMCAPEN